MADQSRDWLANAPPELRETLARAAAGMPGNVALMHLFMNASRPDEAERALRDAAGRLRSTGDDAGTARLLALLDLLRVNPQAAGVVRSVLGGLDHDRDAVEAGDQLSYWAAAFDRAARHNPEASVALYALGNADLLASATAEVVDRLGDWGLLASETECLDLGCGIGRFETALAGRVRRIVGVDISEAMVETARRRTEGLRNVEIRQVAGRDLAGFAARSFDLVLAVDAFPYLVQSGRSLADAMLAEMARVLRPGGHLVILNFSYRGDLELDRTDVRDFADSSRLTPVRDGSADFQFWDGVTFMLRKP